VQGICRAGIVTMNTHLESKKPGVFEKPSVRRYQPTDLEAVKHLHRIGLEANGSYIGSGPWEEDLDTIEQTYLRGGDFFVGYADNKLVVMGALKRIDDTTAEIKRMRTSPDLWRKGYGQAMLEHLEDRARELGFRRIILDTGEKNVGAQRLYEKNEYKKTKQERKPYLPFDSIFYEKSLV